MQRPISFRALALLAVATVGWSVPAAAAPKPPIQEPPAVADDSNKIPQPFAVFTGLDKITGRIINFDVAIDETVQFGALQVTPRVCYSRPQTVAPLTTSFVEVDEITLDNKIRRIFTGWMFADSPGLHAVEHAVYDVWLVDCKGATQDPAAAKKAPAAAPPAAPPAAPATAPAPAAAPHAAAPAVPKPVAPAPAVGGDAGLAPPPAPAPVKPKPPKPAVQPLTPVDGGATPPGLAPLR